MKITIKSTKTIELVDGVPVRLWVGKTERGTKIVAYIAAVEINKDEPETSEFMNELIQIKKLINL